MKQLKENFHILGNSLICSLLDYVSLIFACSTSVTVSSPNTKLDAELLQICKWHQTLSIISKMSNYAFKILWVTGTRSFVYLSLA